MTPLGSKARTKQKHTEREVKNMYFLCIYGDTYTHHLMCCFTAKIHKIIFQNKNQTTIYRIILRCNDICFHNCN